jgi:hypothetical protein
MRIAAKYFDQVVLGNKIDMEESKRVVSDGNLVSP